MHKHVQTVYEHVQTVHEHKHMLTLHVDVHAYTDSYVHMGVSQNPLFPKPVVQLGMKKPTKKTCEKTYEKNYTKKQMENQ